MSRHDRNPTPIDRLLTYREASEVLGVSERCLWTMVDQGALRAVRFGRSVRIDPNDLRAFIERAKGDEIGGGR